PDFFKMLLFTGARLGNVESMRWSEIDLKAGTWRIPGEKFKTGVPLTIALTTPALEILKRRRSELPSDTEWVFPAASTPGHVVNPYKPWRKVMKATKLKDIRIHDLRRTLGSWMT